MLIEKETGRGVLHLYKLKTSSIYQIYYIFHLPFSKEVIRRILSAILQ